MFTGRRYYRNKVRIGNNGVLSGRELRKRLEEEHYSGEPINWAHMLYDGINSPSAVRSASNKRRALYRMSECGVPTPQLYTFLEARTAVSGGVRVVGRTSYHTRGSGFWYCESDNDVILARHRGATHFMEFIEEPREFRVHIVHGQSIKISEKFKQYDTNSGVFDEGSWKYPERFRRKITLRTIAKQAVEALELDFGAVDILYKKIGGEPKFFVLEVNTAPNLTESINNDTLERYVKAFMEGARDGAE